MGSSHTKDENITIFMQTNKDFYFSGEYVEGEIYIRATKPSQYTKLVIQLYGEQYIKWLQPHGKSSTTYRNKYQNYNSSFVVMDFNGLLNQNDYMIPFAFLLPSMITGSFFISPNYYLKYTLKAELVHLTDPKRNQFYEMFLNTIQPPRMIFSPITATDTVRSKCCECCADYGTVSATMNCDKNIVMNGDKIEVNGVIDNTRGTQIITNSRVTFERRRWKMAKNGFINDDYQEQFQFHRIGTIQPKSSQNFKFSANIPQGLVHSTAIGKILSLYYVLHLQTEYGCQAKNVDVQLHLMFQSKKPEVMIPQIIQQPPNWNPLIIQKVVYENMAPYVYAPEPKMRFLNSQSQQTIAYNEYYVLSNNNNQQNLYPQMNEEHGAQDSNRRYKPVFQNDRPINASKYKFSELGSETSEPLIKKL